MQIHDRLLELARIGPMALYTDIDGTISPIASTPDGAQLYPGAADALHSIRAAGVRVVAITGRAAEMPNAWWVWMTLTTPATTVSKC